ncbi:putative membrane protein [Mycobacteroides abscessus subsp. bolletii 1513]|uniref:Putative membrane protein n=1 Tax=Mycobacteroides abscessus subsp. bolletii 1513 TaxID=1299321 RepID=X8E2P2_9MYCO|nr:putative membrane protein [Mycobacteroides abscessus subsp. bolletii 1513]
MPGYCRRMRRAAQLLVAVMAAIFFSGCGSANPLGGGPFRVT